MKKYMIGRIVKVQPEISEEELAGETFSSVADLFENVYSDVKATGVSRYFDDHFMGVKIKGEFKLGFLNSIDWDYIYTLNIDNGIENTNRDRWEAIYPNKDFDERADFGGKKKLYKIHGDAGQFIKTLDYDEMILTESQYIRSLDRNKKFHDMLASDCESKNILYIGCSLDDEIDIKYSVLSDKNRNFSERETYRIYVTAESLSELKKRKLEGFNISHYIQLQSLSDYELFYEFLIRCYQESLAEKTSGISSLEYHPLGIMAPDKNENIKYLADIWKDNKVLPYYYIERDLLDDLKLSAEKINVIAGRRFSGKTMLAYNILDHYQNYSRYFVGGQNSIDTQTIRQLMELRNALIVFDSDSLEDWSFTDIMNSFQAEHKNIVCVLINSYDDVFNLVSYHEREISQPFDHTLNGMISSTDIVEINEKLDEMGISMFDEKNNFLDNTLRIANVYRENIVSGYSIADKNELVVIIWMLVQNRMYYEEIVSLGLARQYRDIVEKFMPFLQEEKCKKGEWRKHSSTKIVCNGKLGLLQILNSFVYPQGTRMGNALIQQRHQDICDSIYHIIYSFSRIDEDIVKKFTMFDTLNDIFSRKYSWESIEYVESEGRRGKNASGAAGLIQMIFSDEKIKKLKASDPNYWLQRAKSIYFTYRKETDIKILYDGIDWALKAEQDSAILTQQGKKQYYRTMSNAIIQTAMLLGRVAKLNHYKNAAENNRAVEYYYKGLSDNNNVEAAKSLISHSRGKDDFDKLVKYLVENWSQVDSEWQAESNFLINIRLNGDTIYSA
ncbi:MAG: SIR2 family protein [bacterium]|nr:SIR2 family protein [bacterium]